jgi:hypothetical protein
VFLCLSVDGLPVGSSWRTNKVEGKWCLTKDSSSEGALSGLEEENDRKIVKNVEAIDYAYMCVC